MCFILLVLCEHERVQTEIEPLNSERIDKKIGKPSEKFRYKTESHFDKSLFDRLYQLKNQNLEGIFII